MNAAKPTRNPRLPIRRGAFFAITLPVVVFFTGCTLTKSGPPVDPVAVAPEPIKERVDTATYSIIEAFNEQDRTAYLAAFDGKPFILAEGAPMISGSEGVTTMYVRAPEGMIYEPMTWGERTFYECGPWVIETGLVEFRYRMYPSGPVIGDPRQVLSIWESAPDGSLKVKLLSWNRLVEMGALDSGESLNAHADLRKLPAISEEGDFAEVLEAERVFHADFLTQTADQNSACYAEDAVLILPGILPLRGAAAIRQHMLEQPANPVLVKVEQEAMHVEGNDQYVLVLNRFNWTFRTGENVPPQTIPGKGVHLWRKGKDGTWRILFDLPNVSVPGL